MSISAEEKVCYLREAAIVLAKEGFQLDEVHTDRLCILLDGVPLCEVTENGGIAYRNKDIDEPERIAAKDKVYEIVRNTAEYMRQMETAPVLKADGLEDGYKVLADFNGTVLAGVQSKHGVHFVTWDWAYGRAGVCHGHYFMENYAEAKQDFAIRSGLIQKERLFTPEQMTEIYRCCADSVDGDFFHFGDAINLDDLLHGQFLAVTEGEQVLTLCIQPRNGSPQIFKPEVLSAASSTGHLTPSQPDSAVSNAFLLRCLAPGFSCDCPRF